MAAVVAAQQQRRNAPPRAVEAGRRLADPGTVAILTGQQAGLFGGPLYTLLKALTAVKLAEQVSREHHVTAVAVFWVEAEDHDWNEVRSCTVFDDALAPKTVSLPRAAGNRFGSGRGGPPGRLDSGVIDELEQTLPATEFRAGVLQGLREAYAPGIGMADAFARWMERILGDLGLIVYDVVGRRLKTARRRRLLAASSPRPARRSWPERPAPSSRRTATTHRSTRRTMGWRSSALKADAG